jgi:hypothetical protein
MLWENFAVCNKIFLSEQTKESTILAVCYKWQWLWSVVCILLSTQCWRVFFSCKFPDSHLYEHFGLYMSCQVQRGSLWRVLGQIYCSVCIASENQELHSTSFTKPGFFGGVWGCDDYIYFEIHPFKCWFQTLFVLQLLARMWVVACGNLGSLGLVTLSKEMSRLFKSDK